MQTSGDKSVATVAKAALDFSKYANADAQGLTKNVDVSLPITVRRPPARG